METKNKKCPKCKVDYIEFMTVMHFKIGDETVYLCEPCSRQFKALKDVIDDKYNENLAESFDMFINER